MTRRRRNRRPPADGERGRAPGISHRLSVKTCGRNVRVPLCETGGLLSPSSVAFLQESLSATIGSMRALKRGEIPSIGELTSFVVAAQHGSFTRAAGELNLTQG